MEEQAAATGREDEAGEKKRGLPLKLILIVFSVLLLGGAAGLIFKPGILQMEAGGQEGGGGAAESETAPDLGPVYTMDSFIVNLMEERGTKYLKTKLGLELDNALVSKEIDERLPQFRDTILTILSTKSFEDIRRLEGKYQLRAEIMAMLNRHLRSGEITNVYFTEFVVQ
jgi:flagellar protein FliL